MNGVGIEKLQQEKAVTIRFTYEHWDFGKICSIDILQGSTMKHQQWQQ